jgi:hypothetical protein
MPSPSRTPSRARVVLRLAGVAVATGLAAGTSAVPALAGPAAPAPDCTQPTVVRAAERADVVFTGTVSRSRPEGQERRRVSVEVDRIYAGSVEEDPATVTVPADERPRVGREWVFFVDSSGGRFTAPACSGGREATASVVRRVEDTLGAGRVYVEPEPPPEPLAYSELDVSEPTSLGRLVAPGAAVFLLGALGLLVTRRR